jgi:hypothetical protein
MSTPLTGEQVSAYAYTLPPLEPAQLGVAVEATAITFGVISTLAAGARIWVRLGLTGAGSKAWGIDDYLFVLGFVSKHTKPDTLEFC